MTKEQINLKLTQILNDILDCGIVDELSMQDCASWDSVAQIDIIMTCEEEFGILFDQSDLPSLTSKAALLEKIQAKLC